jgi:hypothetical protein
MNETCKPVPEQGSSMLGRPYGSGEWLSRMKGEGG